MTHTDAATCAATAALALVFENVAPSLVTECDRSLESLLFPPVPVVQVVQVPQVQIIEKTVKFLTPASELQIVKTPSFRQ